MQRWLSGRRARNQRIEAEADALIRDLGDGAFHEARRREHEASSDAIASDWAEVAVAVARKTGSRIGLDFSSQLAMNTFFVLDREPDEAPELRPSELGPVDKPKRDGIPTPQPFRIQFIGATAGAGPVLREVEIRASDVSAAIIAAAMAPWPPKTTALRILDREGHEVFGRQKGERR